MNLSFIIFIIGLFGFIFNRNNIILLFISIEIMLLGLTINILNTALINYDVDGLIYGIIIIIIAGAESAIGLSILVSYYRLRGHINIENH
jgi:NADH-ubiquinone oxidoreductase chain 4L